MDAKAIWICVQAVAMVVGGWISWFLGGCDALLYGLTAFVVIDYTTGVICAVYEKRLSSAVGFRGIIKKVCIFVLIGVAHIVDGIIGNGGFFRNATLIFLISNEGLSLLENICTITGANVVPPKLLEILSQLRNGKKGD